LSAYDLGAPAKVLQAIYDSAAAPLNPINHGLSKNESVQQINESNWFEFLGEEKYYSAFVPFFTAEVTALGGTKALEKYIFSDNGNANGRVMLRRMMGGSAHPLIQIGYAVEFGSDATVATALSQVAIHVPHFEELFDFTPPDKSAKPISLLEIIRKVYDSDILKPVMPYSDSPMSVRYREARKDGRPEEMRRLTSLWFSADENDADLERKIEELFWVSTLGLAGSGRRGRKPRMDFFLMHTLNAVHFLPSLVKIIPTQEWRIKLVRAFLPGMLMIITTRGRPRIDPELVMTYTATPAPPGGLPKLNPDHSALGDPNDLDCVNPWSGIVDEVIHAPEAHIVKAIRTLYYASKKYGHTYAGNIPGSLKGTEETLPGISKVDGTLFVRAAGVVMDSLGWVTHGDKEQYWDRSALGWDDAWKGDD